MIRNAADEYSERKLDLGASRAVAMEMQRQHRTVQVGRVAAGSNMSELSAMSRKLIQARAESISKHVEHCGFPV